MKRAILIVCAVLSALSMSAAYSLTATKVTVEDVTVDKDNFFVTVDAKTSSGEYEVGFDVWPGKHSLIGSFTTADGTIHFNTSWVHKTEANGKPLNDWYYRPKEGAAISLTVVKKDETTCTLTGSIEAVRDGVTYTYNIGAFDFAYAESGGGEEPPVQDPYRYEPAEATTVNFVGDVVRLEKKEGYIEITLNETKTKKYDWIELKLLSNQLIWPAGDYSITNSGAANTLTASKGYLGQQNDDPCYVAIRDEDWGQYTPYYLESGTVKVTYNAKTDSIFVTGKVTSHFGSNIDIQVAAENLLYDPYDTPQDPEKVTLDIDTVVVTYMRENADEANGKYPYTFNFFKSSEDAFPTVITDLVLSKPMELVAGTYTLAANQLSGIMLYQNQADFNNYFFGGDPYEFNEASLTLTDAGNGKWTYSMVLKNELGSEYSFTMTQAPHIINYPVEQQEIDPKDKPYVAESTEKENITVVFDSIIWKDDKVGKDGILDVYLFERTADKNGLRFAMQLGFYTSTTAIPAGTYPVDGSEEDFTFSASMGYYEPILFPCFLSMIDATDAIQAIWYIVDGSITLSYDSKGHVSLTGNCGSYFGSTIRFSFETTIETSVESRESSVENRKILRDGQLLIIRDGKTYNAQGHIID